MTKSSPWMTSLSLAIYLIINIACTDSSMTFSSSSVGSPLAGLDLYATTLTSFVGPQPEDPIPTVRTGPVVLFTGDICEPIPMHVPGSIILITNGNAPCSYENRYLTIYATGAAAAIWAAVDQVPGLGMYASDGSRGARTRHLTMLFLRIGPSTNLFKQLVANASGMNATVSPDLNVWQTTFASWYYQLFIRFLPSLLMIVSGLTATVYFSFHMSIINAEYKSTTPESRRSLPRWVKFVFKSVGLPHAVLVNEMFTATLPGIVIAVGGFYSTPNLPFPVVEYFVTALDGWSFASSLLSASVWVRHLSRLIESRSVLTRIVRGDYPTLFILLIAIPVALDTTISTLLSMYYNAPTFSTIASAVNFLLQLTVGLHVLLGVMQYYWTVRTVHSKATKAVGQGKGMDAILRRLSRCALGMSLSMFFFCIGTMLMAASPTFMYTPTGWTTCFSLCYIGRAMDSAFRVAMFKPRSVPGTKKTVIPAGEQE